MKPIAILISLALSTAMAEKIGSFEYSEIIDPITDEDTSTAIANSTNKNESLLVFRCKDKKLHVLYFTNVYLGLAFELDVIYRFDDMEPSKIGKWPTSNTMKGVFFPMDSKDAFFNFKADLITWDKIAIRVYDSKGTAYTDTFLLSEAMEVSLRMNCFWY